MVHQDNRRSNKAPKGPKMPLNSCGPGGPTGVIKKGTLKCLAFFVFFQITWQLNSIVNPPQAQTVDYA